MLGEYIIVLIIGTAILVLMFMSNYAQNYIAEVARTKSEIARLKSEQELRQKVDEANELFKKLLEEIEIMRKQVHEIRKGNI